MDLAGVAAILTVALGFLAAILAIAQDRSRLRTLERVATLKAAMSDGDGKNAVGKLESVLAAKMLKRNSPPLLVKLAASTVVLGLIGVLLVVQQGDPFVYSIAGLLGMPPNSIFQVRGLLAAAGIVLLYAAMGSLIVFIVVSAPKVIPSIQRKINKVKLSRAKKHGTHSDE